MITRTRKIIKRQKDGNQRVATGVIVLFVILAATFLAYSNWKLYRQRVELNNQLKITDQKLAVLLGKNKILKEGIGDLSDPVKMEEAARDKMLLKKQGEEVVVVIPPEEKPISVPEKELNWWQKILKTIGVDD
ncbi:MAG: septum formation initiator family protein [bacterium]